MTAFTLHRRKKKSIENPPVSSKKLRTEGTNVTPLKRSHSSTQLTPKTTKQTSSQRTPLKQKSSGVQVSATCSSKSSSAIPLTSTRATNTADTYVKDKTTQIDSSPLNINLCKHSDKDIMMYTGLNTYALFKIVFDYINAPCGEEDCQVENHKACPETLFPGIEPENQFFLVLYKLRQCPTDKKVAAEFGTSDAQVSRVFHFWNMRMYRKFKLLNICPPNEVMQQHMTAPVKKRWPNLREILDGTEMKCQKPSDPLTQKQMWSNYKHDHTVKVQIGCSSTGVITSISDTYGGSVSDKELFSKSGVLEHLNENDALMVDKGFLILDLLQGTDVELIRPPFLASGTQFDMADRDLGREIAKARIVVENVNSRFKRFKILSIRINIKYLTIVNEIVYNCCCLSNFGPPMRKT